MPKNPSVTLGAHYEKFISKQLTQVKAEQLANKLKALNEIIH